MFLEKIKSLAPLQPVFERRTVQHVARRYTAYAMPAHAVGRIRRQTLVLIPHTSARLREVTSRKARTWTVTGMRTPDIKT